MIKNLLAYQEKDKERLAILAGVEDGRVKREINAANRSLDESKQTLLALENDAKTLAAAYESSTKNLKELFARIDQFSKTTSSIKSEDENASATAYVSALSQKVTGYESQLEDLAKRINAKSAAFEDAKSAVVGAQKKVAMLTPEYQRQRKEIEPKLSVVEKELLKLGGAVDRELLEKYKKCRAADKSGKVTDVAVAVTGERCGACYHEMPTLLVHKIKTNGYIICENCGKIIY